MPSSDLTRRVEESIRERKLFRSGQRILVAVSGGLDSVVLLHLLAQLSAPQRWRLTVAHFNHRLRGRSSDADERLVKMTAQNLGCRFVAGRADVRAFARRHGLSVEMAARKLRHDFLARAARRRKIPTVALAHHADDQLELFFLRLLRGSSGEGLAGMKWRNPSPSDASVELVRPLLGTPKAALRRCATAHGLAWREDATNALVEFQRNRIRHRLLPWLRRNFGGAPEKTVARLMEIVGAESEFVAQAAEAWLAHRIAASRASRRAGPAGDQSHLVSHMPFDGLPVAVQRRCLQLQLLRLRLAPDFELIEQLRREPDRAVSVGPNCGVRRDETGLVALHRPARPERKGRKSGGDSARLRLQASAGKAVFGGVQFAWQIRATRGARRGKPEAGREFFDADKTGRRVMLRHWRAGDRFQPAGMVAAVKLQDLFTNRKIPRAQRHRLVVAEAENGAVFWVEGLRIAEHFKLDKQTRQRLKWAWKRLAPAG